MKAGRLALINTLTWAIIGALCLALSVGPLHAQTSQQPPPTTQATPTPTPTPKPDPPPPPDNLDRIRAGVQRPASLSAKPGQLRIYVDVLAKAPTFQDLTKDYDWLNGPTGRPNNAMSHQEFLGMMTPKEMYGSGGIQTGEILTMAAVNFVGQALLKKGLKAIGDARQSRSDKKISAIQTQIDRELAALRGGK